MSGRDFVLHSNGVANLRRGVLVQQDSTPVPPRQTAMGAVKQCGFEVLPYPPYSPDRGPND